MYVKRILPNGVRLITERIDNMRTVSVGIWVGNGRRYEPAELGGVSHFIEHMIFKGTEKRSARHIAIAIDALGGQANAFTDKECTCYYMKVLDSRLKNAVALLADMFLHSRFAQEDLELERGVVLEEIDMYEDSPEDVAIDKLFESCYSKCRDARRGETAGADDLGNTAQVYARILPSAGYSCCGFRPFYR